MIYLFCGNDTKNKYTSYIKFIESIPKGMETFFIGKNDFNPTQVESFYSSSGLFFTESMVIFTNIFEKEETLNFILKKLNFISESKSKFVFLEGKLNKTILDAFKKNRAEINVFELSKEKQEKFNNFLLANALGRRDKLNLWINFRQAIDVGVEMEELVGVLFWKAKDMLLNKDFNKFSATELKKFTNRISYLLPEARKNGKDAETVFEQFLLEAF